MKPLVQYLREHRLVAFALGGFLFVSMMSLIYLGSILSILMGIAGYDLKIRDIDWHSPMHVEIEGIELNTYLKMETLDVRWKLWQLPFGYIEEVRLYKLEFLQSEWNKESPGDAKKDIEKVEEAGGMPWIPLTIQNFIINDGIVILDGLGKGLPPIPVHFGEVTPMVIKNISFGHLFSTKEEDELITAQIDRFEIPSPYDPLSKVIKFENISITFTWAGLKENKLEQVIFTHPVVYIGEDLFWFVDALKASPDEPPSQSKPWYIGYFKIQGGRLALSVYGKPQFYLPFIFEAEQSGITLADFDKLHLNADIKIPRTNLYYPEYDLEITDMEGALYFKLPVKEENAENLVPSVKAKQIKMKGMQVDDVYLWLTFDRTGAYGDVRASAYDGYLNGGFSFKFDQVDLPWQVWFNINKVDLKRFTDKQSKDYFTMTGKLNSNATAKGHSKVVESINANMKLTQPGKMEIPAVGLAMEKIPTEWAPFKQQLAKIGLNALREYSYNSGNFDLTYQDKEKLANVKMKLESPQGNRQFEISLQDFSF